MKRISNILSIILLILSTYLLTHPLFFLHGMKEWPMLLFAVSLAMIGISLVFDLEGLPLFTALGYGIGFLAAFYLQSEGTDPGGGRTSDLWIIWTGVFLGFILAGVIFALIRKRRGK